MFAVLDEGCNRTCHGSKWVKNAQEKLAKLGRALGPLKGEPRTYSGLGTTETAGRRTIPWGTFLSNGEHIGGALTSNEMKGSQNLPLLLSLGAQSTLGLQKDTRSGKCYLPYYGAELKLYEVEGSELRAICISEFLEEPDEHILARGARAVVSSGESPIAAVVTSPTIP